MPMFEPLGGCQGIRAAGITQGWFSQGCTCSLQLLGFLCPCLWASCVPVSRLPASGSFVSIELQL